RRRCGAGGYPGRRLGRSSVVAHAAAHEHALEDRDDHQEHEHHHRDGGGVAELQALEGAREQVVHDDLGGAERPGAGHDVDGREDLERVDHLQHEDQVGGGRQQRPGDVAEHRPAGGAVDLGRLVVLVRDVEQAGQVDDHVVAGALPDDQQDDGRHRPLLVGEPVDGGAAEQLDDLVEEADARVVQPLPHHRHRHHRGDDRQEEGGAEDAHAAHAGGQRHGEQQRQGHLERHAGGHEVEGVPDGVPEAPVVPQPHVVVEADGLGGGPQQQPVGEADAEDVDGGQVLEGEQDGGGGQQEQVRLQRLHHAAAGHEAQAALAGGGGGLHPRPGV